MKTKILIIEDNEQNMYMLSYLLEQNNYEVYKTYSAGDGIKSAQKFLPDIILLDIQLPEMDGYTVTRKLREKKELRTTPIIAVTSYAMPGDKEKVMAAGATGYIEKPIDPDNFIETMIKIVYDNKRRKYEN